VRGTRLLAVVACALLAAGCTTGPDPSPSGTSTTTGVSPTTTPTGEPTTSSPTPTTPTGLEQPAIWPAADVVLATPEEAAAAFAAVLTAEPRLGPFMQGDARSGEIELLFGESTADPVVRSLLLVRMLGPDDGWFVIGAVNDHAAITSPEAGATVPAGPLTVTGVGRGFEALVAVEAYLPGNPEPIAREVTQGGAMEDSEPFTVTLDLSSASPGDVVSLVVRGGTGHELDPGDVGAIPVVIG
jgi:hypothetical protein